MHHEPVDLFDGEPPTRRDDRYDKIGVDLAAIARRLAVLTVELRNVAEQVGRLQ